VTEVCIDHPARQEVIQIIWEENGREAAADIFPNTLEKWEEWTQEEGVKLATGLLSHAPEITRIIKVWISIEHFRDIVGKAILHLGTLGTPPTDLRQLGGRNFRLYPGTTEYDAYRFLNDLWTPPQDHPEFVSPLALAMAAGYLPSLAKLDMNRFKSSSLMVVAQAIGDGRLPNLVELHVALWGQNSDQRLEVVRAFARAYARREGAKQAMLEVVSITYNRDVQPLTELLGSPFAQELSTLHLHFDSVTDRFDVLNTYLCGPEARQNKRPHLTRLTLFFLQDGTFMPMFVEALADHGVCPNLSLLRFRMLTSEKIPLLARVYERGGFRNLRELDIGRVISGEDGASHLRQFLTRVSQTSDKGTALEVLEGENKEQASGELAIALCDGLKAGAFPRLQELRLMYIFKGAHIQHLIAAMAGATPDTETCRATLRCIRIDFYTLTQEAALRQVLGGDELTIHGRKFD
jgi:hypothetical protein